MSKLYARMKPKYRHILNEWCPQMEHRRLDWNTWHEIAQQHLVFDEHCRVILRADDGLHTDPVMIDDHGSGGWLTIYGRNVWSCLVTLLVWRKRQQRPDVLHPRCMEDVFSVVRLKAAGGEG